MDLEMEPAIEAERNGDGALVSLTLWGKPWRLGQVVRASGSFGVPAGTLGYIAGLALPYQDSRTSDVLSVRFANEPCPMTVKPEDVVDA